jgi:hypothetical protein
MAFAASEYVKAGSREYPYLPLSFLCSMFSVTYDFLFLSLWITTALRILK